MKPEILLKVKIQKMKYEIITCPVCGKKFQAQRSGHKYCSKRCRNKKGNLLRKIQSDEELYEKYLKTQPERPDDFETFVEKRKANNYRIKHHITIEYCESHNVCYECPYPFNVCLFE